MFQIMPRQKHVIFFWDNVFLFSQQFSPTSSLTYLAPCSFRQRKATVFVLYFQSLSKLQIYLYVGQLPSWKIYQVHYPGGDPWWWFQAFKLTYEISLDQYANLTRPILQWTQCEARCFRNKTHHCKNKRYLN